jgi:hypothetical protein
MEAFGVVDLLQKGLQVRLCLLKRLVALHLYLLVLHCLRETFRSRILGGLPRGGHTDLGTDAGGL